MEAPKLVTLPFTKEEAIQKFLSLEFEELTPLAVKFTRFYYLDDEEFKELLKHIGMESTGISYNIITNNEVTFIKK